MVQVHLGPPVSESAAPVGEVGEGVPMRRLLVLAAVALAAVTVARRRSIDDEDLWTEATKAPDLR